MAEARKLLERTVDPLDDQHRCSDFDGDCSEVPGTTPNGERRSHLGCWLHDPSKGWCPYLIARAAQGEG